MLSGCRRFLAWPALINRAQLARNPSRRNFAARRSSTPTCNETVADSAAADVVENVTTPDLPHPETPTKYTAPSETWTGLEAHQLGLPYSAELYRYPTDSRALKRNRAIENLRYCLGYAQHDFTRSYLNPRTGPKFRGTNMADIRFLCLDVDIVKHFDNPDPEDAKRRIRSLHLGISVLDVRDILALVHSPVAIPNPARVIQSWQYWVNEEEPGPDKFLFGKSETVSVAQAQAKLDELRRGRYTALILFDAASDLQRMKDFGIDATCLIPIDLQKATYVPLQRTWPISLNYLLSDMGIPSQDLHSAGNDTHFTLRAMLMLAVVDVLRYLEPKDYPSWLQAAVNIAHSPVVNLNPNYDPAPDPELIGRRATWMEKRRARRKMLREADRIAQQNT
ncbi:hypothetical protein F66182_5350 [Fusarium sp. NRRL 66182]|nr:hypothetical protein F66182_5350 [Fusarium sp. NRRL 66182]